MTLPPPRLTPSSRRGSALIVALILLGFAGFIIGSLLTMATSFAWNSERTYRHDKAFFLADAGLRAALVQLNTTGEATIPYDASRAFFADAQPFLASDWGFSTRLTTATNGSVIEATGRYGGSTASVSARVALGSGQRSIHALYAHALFAGNRSDDPGYVLRVGGTGLGADFVKGDVYSGNAIELTGDARLRLPELLDDANGDRLCDSEESWQNAHAVECCSNGMTQAEFDAYAAAHAADLENGYNNGQYDYGEAFADTIGNGQYDEGEPFEDLNGNGVWDPAGDSFIDRNGNGQYDSGVDTVVDHGNGQYDSGEEWTEDASHSQRQNGRYDPAGGYWSLNSGVWSWKTSYRSGWRTYSCASWTAESFEDVGDGVYVPCEPYTDQNGVYDPGEAYFDDRNDVYDYGTQARGAVSGLPAPGPGQSAATGFDAAIDPPDLSRMYYAEPRTGPAPSDAFARWGHDVKVSADDYGSARAIATLTTPEHIFVRNPPVSGSVSSAGRTIYGRSYSYTYATNGARIDDYFLEDPAHSGYNSSPAPSIDGSTQTRSMYLNVTPEANNLLYFVDGNLYLHNPQVYSLRFLNPGTRITIVANGNITISDEFYYNADYASDLTPDTMSSTIVRNPADALCLIALINPAAPTNSGNIFIGDAQFGTGGSIHALLYAQNNFVDNNLNTADQPYLSIYGNMTAGNQILLNRAGANRTRLDVTLDERVRSGQIMVPGLPHPLGTQRSITVNHAWQVVPGTWTSFSGIAGAP